MSLYAGQDLYISVPYTVSVLMTLWPSGIHVEWSLMIGFQRKAFPGLMDLRRSIHQMRRYFNTMLYWSITRWPIPWAYWGGSRFKPYLKWICSCFKSLCIKMLPKSLDLASQTPEFVWLRPWVC